MTRRPSDLLTAPAAPSGLAPVAAGERVHVLDVLRGFALSGVLLANMVWWFSGYGSLDAEAAAALPTAAFDAVVVELQWFFVDGKFISIFSFLFGVGFAIQMGRARVRGTEITPVYVRRMLWLLLFGVAHMLFLWYGDILHLYAVLGLLLIGWTHRSDRSLVRWGVVFTVLVPLAIRATLRGLPIITGGTLDLLDGFAAHREAVAALRPVFEHGAYLDVVRVNVAETWLWLATDDAWKTGAASFGKFLLGFWAARTGILLRAGTDQEGTSRTLLRRGLAWGLAIGVVCQGALLVVERLPAQPLVPETWAADVGLDLLYRVGIPAMALGYVCGIILLFQRPAWRGALHLFAPVGRMALTNYLGQSVICVFIFYGWGLGWYGDVGPTACVGLTVVVFLAQAAASRWWLSRFRFGPAEWAWRRLTYGGPQPLRLTAAVATSPK
jgi:uncharacterized protein